MSDLSDVEADLATLPLDSGPQITIIIPTRNESGNIPPLLDRLARTLADLPIEVLFIDDSTDDTAGVVDSLAREFALPIRVIRRPVDRRNGLSGAVVEGIVAADGAWVCVMDADLQHPPEAITRMWEQAQKTGADIVVGSRRGDLFGPFGLSRLRSMNSKLLTVLARTLFPRRLKNVSDPLTGLFLVRREALNVGDLRPDGFKILLEILVRCPALHVTEVHFDFAPRYSGESKADVREGARFLRHLVVLRSTANPHLGRFLMVVLLGLLTSTALLAALLYWGMSSPLFAVLVASELAWLGIFLAFEFWVFNDRDRSGRRRRFWGFFFLTQLTLVAVYFPVLMVMLRVLDADILTANVIAFIVVGFFRYLLSEQSVWTRSAMVWQPESHYYNLHGLLAIESHIPLRELDQFRVAELSTSVDLQIRVDRQGTPSDLPGGISYDEHLGRFGFGLLILPGPYTRIVVSPLLEHSPDFLFTNIVEPVLRWRLVLNGYALAKAACVGNGGTALLISADMDLGRAVAQLCIRTGHSFLADDRTILDAAGQVYSYPKPLTVDRGMLDDSGWQPALRNRAALWTQRLLYTRIARRIGLWLGELDLPAATLNTYLQRFVPQPKFHVQKIYPDITLGTRAVLSKIVRVQEGSSPESDCRALSLCLQPDTLAVGFQPLPLLAEKMRVWDGEDLVKKEQLIIEQAIQGVPVQYIEATRHEWWQEVADDVAEAQNGRNATAEPGMLGVAKERIINPHGELGTT